MPQNPRNAPSLACPYRSKIRPGSQVVGALDAGGSVRYYAVA